jgi:hypothetical protein
MTKQMTPLRQRMIEDMTIRNMSPSTQKIYVAAVANFSIFTDQHVGFRWKDYRENGQHKDKVMELAAGEFMRRFLLHVLPEGFIVFVIMVCSRMDTVRTN